MGGLRGRVASSLGPRRLVVLRAARDRVRLWREWVGNRHDRNRRVVSQPREDRIDHGVMSNSLADIMSFQSWNNYCESGDDGHQYYSPAEEAAFALFFNGDQIQNSNDDPFPYLRGLMTELAGAPVDLLSTDPIQKRRANERVQAALAFIFATPYVFAEGQ